MSLSDSHWMLVGIGVAALLLGASYALTSLWSDGTKTGMIVLRSQSWKPSQSSDVFDIRFSFLNSGGEPLYVNEMFFLEGGL